MKRITIILMLLSIISKIIGFFRDIVLSYFYGASNTSDAYIISLTIPKLIFSFIAVAISTGYIPMYSKIENDYGVNESNKYTSNLLNILLIFSTVICIFIFLFTDKIIKMFAHGFSGEAFDLSVNFTKINIIGIYFSSIICIAVPFLQLKKKYVIPALIGIPFNVITILSILISYKINIMALPIGSIFSEFFQVIVLAPFVYKYGYRYDKILDFNDKFIKNMIITVLPVMVSVSMNQINILVDRTLASGLGEGSISSLDYASKLNGFIHGVIVMSIANVIYPYISKLIAEKKICELKKVIVKSVSVLNLLICPVIIGTMFFSESIVKFLFDRGKFDENAIMMTSNALFFYSVGMLAFALREILLRVFYSMQETKKTTINGIIGLILNIVFNLILSKYLGVGGLALSTSISAIFTTILMIIDLRKKIGGFEIRRIFINFLKILIISLFMGFFSKVCFNYLIISVNFNISLIISIFIGIIVYVSIIYYMKIENINITINSIFSKLIKIN